MLETKQKTKQNKFTQKHFKKKLKKKIKLHAFNFYYKLNIQMTQLHFDLQKKIQNLHNPNFNNNHTRSLIYGLVKVNYFLNFLAQNIFNYPDFSRKKQFFLFPKEILLFKNLYFKSYNTRTLLTHSLWSLFRLVGVFYTFQFL